MEKYYEIIEYLSTLNKDYTFKDKRPYISIPRDVIFNQLVIRLQISKALGEVDCTEHEHSFTKETFDKDLQLLSSLVENYSDDELINLYIEMNKQENHSRNVSIMFSLYHKEKSGKIYASDLRERILRIKNIKKCLKQ